MTSFYIPCVVMILLYWRIYLAIRGRTRQALKTGRRRVSSSKVLDGTNFHNTAAAEQSEEEEGGGGDGQEGKEGGAEKEDDEDGETHEPGRKDALEAVVAAVPGCFDEAPNETRFGDDGDQNEERYSDPVFYSTIANAFFVDDDDDCIGAEEASENLDRVPSGYGRHQLESESLLGGDMSTLTVNGSFLAHARAEKVMKTVSSPEATRIEDYERRFATRDYGAACSAGNVKGPAVPSINIQLANTMSNHIDATQSSCVVKNSHNLSTAAPWVANTRTCRAASWRFGSAKSKLQGSSRPGRRRINFRDLSGRDCPPAANAGLGTTLLAAEKSSSVITAESKRESSFVQYSAKYVFGDRGLEIAETALSAKRKRVAKREKKATKTLAIVLGEFDRSYLSAVTVHTVNVSTMYLPL